MGQTPTIAIEAPASIPESGTLICVLTAASFCHLLNDMVQSLLPSVYPILKSSFHLNFNLKVREGIVNCLGVTVNISSISFILFLIK